MRLSGFGPVALSLLLSAAAAPPQPSRSPQTVVWSDATRLFDQQRFAESERVFRRLASTSSARFPALAFLALCEYETGKYDESLRHFQQWAKAKSPGTPDLAAMARLKWALLLTRGGAFEQANYLLTIEAKADNRDPAVVEALGLAALRMKALPEGYAPVDREPVYIAGRAAFEAAVHRYDRAETWALKLLPKYGGRPGVHYLLGNLYLAGNKKAEAATEFRKDLEISPDDVNTILQVAIAQYDAGESAESASLAERAVALSPDYFPAHNVLGRAYLNLKRYSDSVKELELAKKLAPQNAQVRFFLAKAYMAMGREADAERERAVFSQFQERDHLQREKEAGAR